MKQPTCRSLQTDTEANLLASATGDRMWKILRGRLPKARQKRSNAPLQFHGSHAQFTKHFAAVEEPVPVPGMMVPELLRANPREAALMLFPALIQTVVQQQTCFVWKAGFYFLCIRRMVILLR